MENKAIRLLNADEIEVRISTISEKGVSLLLYKDARVDQKILDEAFGIFGWQRKHESIDGNLYCTVAIKDNSTGEWIEKQDVGTKNLTEVEKSQASDSFKRACFNIGIGRELYSAPFIWVSASNINIQKDGSRFRCYDRFRVTYICYDENREISGLIISNEKGNPIYTWGSVNRNVENPKGRSQVNEEKKATVSKRKIKEPVNKEDSTAAANTPPPDGENGAVITGIQMDSLYRVLERTGVTMDAVQKRYNVQEPGQMSPELYSKVMSALSKTKSAKVA